MSVTIPPLGFSALSPAFSSGGTLLSTAAQNVGGVVGGALAGLMGSVFPPTQTIAGLPTAPPPPPPPVLPATNLGAVFTSVATPLPTPEELVAQLNATTDLADFNKPQLEHVINVRGNPLKPTKDPLEMEISAGNQLLNKIRTRGIDPKDLTGDIKINYDRALELKRQVTAKAAATKARKEAASESKKRERHKKRINIITIRNSIGITQPRNKSTKAIKNKSRKNSRKSGKSRGSRRKLIIINLIHIIIYKLYFIFIFHI